MLAATLRGHWWMIRRFGVRTWWRYERLRRSGYRFDYASVFTPAQIHALDEHGLLPPPRQR